MDINPDNPTATAAYITGRKRYSRPQAMLWSNNPGTSVDSVVFPNGMEKEDFIICSDHNRSEISISQQRIESRQRMINGTMRSYHVADKITVSTSWQMLPSRSHSKLVTYYSDGSPKNNNQEQFYTENGLAKPQFYDEQTETYIPSTPTATVEYTADGGAGGVELLDWYETHQGPFYVYFAYDKYNNLTVGGTIQDGSFIHLDKYNDVRLMYFASFEHSIQKRGGTNHDLWNVSVTLEEV